MAKHCLFIPALMPTYSKYFTLSNQELFEKSPNLRASGVTARWFAEKDSFFYYPYILLSAAHHYKFKNFRDMCKMTKDTFVMVDSGGFQLATGKAPKDYNEKTALDWSEENGNVYPILDRPIVTDKQRDEHIRLTRDAAKYYLDHRTKPDHHILNVASGKAINAVSSWYDSVKDFRFDGWSHGGHHGNIISMLQTFFLLFNNGEFDRDKLNYYHVFGTSSFSAMFYLGILQRWLDSTGRKTQITYDSSTQTKTLAYGKIVHSLDWTGLKVVSLSNRISFGDHTVKGMYCDCPVCQNITDFNSLMLENREFEFYYLLHQHNLYQVLKGKRFIDWAGDVTGGWKIDSHIVDSSLPAVYATNLKVLYKACEDPNNAIEWISREFRWSGANDTSENGATLENFMD